jgi:hypothetical protein
MLLLFYTVARQLGKQPEWKNSIRQILEAAAGLQQWKLYAMFGLMGVNWALESLKWQIALSSVQTIPFFRAFKAILAGASIASFTPNRVGEYLGRMLFVEPGNKIGSITPTILCSMSQMLATLSLGSVGLYFFSFLTLHFQAAWISPAFIRSAFVVTAACATGLGFVYFRFDPLAGWLNNWLKKNEKTFSIPQDFRFRVLAGILLISTFRYGVFILQYYLLFSLFEIPLSAGQVFTGVSVMFVLMAVVPTLTFLTDLGFRWVAGIQIFQLFTANTAGILAVSMGVWLINLIIPALVGSLLILRIKLFRSK